MKKLLLKNLDLSSDDMLNRDHLKTIFGGYGGYGGSTSTCIATCYNGKSVSCQGRDCVALDYVGCSTRHDSNDCPPKMYYV